MIYLIITTSISNKYLVNQKNMAENRMMQYAENIKKTLSLLPSSMKAIIVENNGPRKTFLDDFGIPVHYTQNNDERFQHKGINELNDIKSVIKTYDIKDDDMVIKITGRYSPLNDVFFKYVEANQETYDAFIKFYNVAEMLFMEDDCVLGMFAVKCKYLKQFQYDNGNRSPETQFAKFMNKIDGEICEVGILYLHCCFSETMKYMDV